MISPYVTGLPTHGTVTAATTAAQPYGSSSSLISIKEYLQCRQPCNFGISLLLTMSVEL